MRVRNKDEKSIFFILKIKIYYNFKRKIIIIYLIDIPHLAPKISKKNNRTEKNYKVHSLKYCKSNSNNKNKETK